jgi:membrane fusion protein (multidrug efflux system)
MRPEVAPSFARTLRALDADGMSPAMLGVLLIAVLGGVWSTWLVLARVPVYQISQSARLEVERVHPIASPVTGRLVSTSLVLGREVKIGDVLLEIEADREKLETAEEQARLSTVAGEITALQREIGAEEDALAQFGAAAAAELEEARQRLAAAEAAAARAEEDLRRSQLLVSQGLVSAADAQKAQAEAQGRRADVGAARAGIEKLRAEQSVAERGRRGRLAGLLRQRVSLDGLRTTTASSVALREREAERRRVRAPVAGRLGDVNPVQIGAIVREGEFVGAIVPDGNVRVVADFAAPALGRLHPGQRARLRLDGFSWTQYGHVQATVTRVASETREQRVRVELAVQHDAASQIPLRHGMPGIAEIEVERVAPLALLVRSLGRTISGEPVAAAGSRQPAETRTP